MDDLAEKKIMFYESGGKGFKEKIPYCQKNNFKEEENEKESELFDKKKVKFEVHNNRNEVEK